MSDFNLQLLFEIVTKGGPQAQEAIKQVTDAAKAGSPEAIALLERVAKQEGKVAESVKTVTAAHEELAAAMARVFAASDSELTIREQKKITTAIQETGDTSGLTVRQLRELERAAQKAGGETVTAFEKLNRGSTAGRRGSSYAPRDTAAEQKAFEDEAAAIRKQREQAANSEEEGGHNKAALTRHFGAVAGQVLGMPGMGMMVGAGGMAAGIGVAVLAAEKATHAFGEWAASIDKIVTLSQDFDTVAQRIDSIAIASAKLAEHSRMTAHSYAQISREVNTVEAAIKRLTTLEATRAAAEEEFAKARLEQIKAEIALRTIGNPLATIEQTAAAEKAAKAAAHGRTRENEQREVDVQMAKFEQATDREQEFAAKAERIKKVLPRLQDQANKDEEKAKAIAAVEAERVASANKETLLLDNLINQPGYESMGAYMKFRAGASAAENESSDASDAILGNAAKAPLHPLGPIAGLGSAAEKSQAAAIQRRIDLAERIKQSKIQQDTAEKLALKKRGTATLAETTLAESEGEVKKAGTDAETALRTATEMREVIAEKERLRQRTIEAEERAAEARKQKEERDAMRTNFRPGPSASIGNDFSPMNNAPQVAQVNTSGLSTQLAELIKETATGNALTKQLLAEWRAV